ncbi:unnamed protein product [Rhizoctonia solani]|uniref:Uncharacterized protein n=1 Tax=Rhizoctonia solani TaxID=456999 RepID=A0A8H3CRM8_9AGAM|nr:unnamed protein product [Rhizoctonia solani]CAE6496213.1 unnamed protein product [Rhizoctonia solani]
MAGEGSLAHVGPSSTIGHGSAQNQRSSGSSGAPSSLGTTYIRVGRGIVPVARYERNMPRGRNIAGDLAMTTSVYGIDGEISPGGAPKQKWYKQPFMRKRYLSFQGALSGRATSTTDANTLPPTTREVESPVIDATPARLEPNETCRKLRKPRSRSPLPPVSVSPTQPIPRHNLASTPPPRPVQSMYVQSSTTRDEPEEDSLEDGQLLLDLLGVNETPPTPGPETEQAQLHRIPTPEPEQAPEPESESEPDQCVTPTPIRRLPPVPILNIIPPHDSQDAFAYVFGPNHRTAYMEHRGPAAPPPYIARQSAILDRYTRPARDQPILPDQKRELSLPLVAPLSIRCKDKLRNTGGTRH